jgi:3-hydroxybutyryl-CoA dehydratase
MSTDWSGNPLLESWAETSTRMVENAIAANKAAVSAWSVPQTNGDGGASPEVPPIDRIEPAEDLAEWHVEMTADDREELTVGDRFVFTKTITEADVKSFAAASGDTNPLHLDDEYANTTRFKGRIAHGTLVGGLISAALARVPGLVIYLSQDLEFHNPVRIDDRISAECEIVEDLGNDQYRLRTQVMNGDDTAIDGEAVILVDQDPGE